jgi:ketosteroid isomerase-like protein
MPDNITVTQGAYERFGAGDIPGMLEFLSPEVVIEFYGPDVIPYAGTWRGHAEVTRWLETIFASLEVRRFEPQEMLADADKVVTTGTLELVARSTGQGFASDFVHVITLADGRWVRFRDWMNTAAAAEAFSAPAITAA